jgi:hypothetical protein
MVIVDAVPAAAVTLAVLASVAVLFVDPGKFTENVLPAASAEAGVSVKVAVPADPIVTTLS